MIFLKKEFVKICPRCGGLEVAEKVSISKNLVGDSCKDCGFASVVFPKVEKNQVKKFRKILTRKRQR